jgi:3'(2'), 5'-bisphosphate nucleotidase
MKGLLELAVRAALCAGKEILDVYSKDFEVEFKLDESPLTIADQRSHLIIEESLRIAGKPILSEEGKEFPYENRKDWKELWIVDPLDGTKEFVKRNGEFTVNIALIRENYPVLGVIYVPVTGVLYWGSSEGGAWKASVPVKMGVSIPTMNEIETMAVPLPLVQKRDVRKIVASRSHMSPETESFIKDQEAQFGAIELVSMGSSLKICLIAEGEADVYPRFAPTMEWDTAAGQAIVEAAGKTFVDYKSGERMKYNRNQLLNDWFLVS